MKPANLIAESEVYMKVGEIKMGVYKVICIAAKNHGQAFSQSFLSSRYSCIDHDGIDAQMSIMQNLQYTEHLSEPMADLVMILAKEFDYSQLGEEILRSVFRALFVSLTDDGENREIAAKQFDMKDTRGPKTFSKFLIRLAENAPRLVLKQIALLQKHLDSEVGSFVPLLDHD